MFKRCCFKFMPVTVPFSKSTVFKICRQKMCRFRVNRRPIRHIFHRFQNLPASCERSLKTAFTRCRRKLDGKDSLQGFDAKEVCLHPKNLSVSFQKRQKMFCFHHFQVFTRCSFPNVPIRVPFSKSTVFKMCRQKCAVFV